MALPDPDKVIQELNRRFAAPLPEFYNRRIIFWYDEDRDFEEKSRAERLSWRMRSLSHSTIRIILKSRSS